eukprot:6186417-Pleurochrysis_carterae.AAC.1
MDLVSSGFLWTSRVLASQARDLELALSRSQLELHEMVRLHKCCEEGKLVSMWMRAPGSCEFDAALLKARGSCVLAVQAVRHSAALEGALRRARAAEAAVDAHQAEHEAAVAALKAKACARVPAQAFAQAAKRTCVCARARVSALRAYECTPCTCAYAHASCAQEGPSTPRCARLALSQGEQCVLRTLGSAADKLSSTRCGTCPASARSTSCAHLRPNAASQAMAI